MMARRITFFALASTVLLYGCTDAEVIDADCASDPCACEPSGCDGAGGKADSAIGYSALNYRAGTMVLYEVQARTANACHPDVGADWQRQACAEKIAPTIPYRAEGMTCGELSELEQIKLGTLDDMLEPTDDYRAGITLRYIQEKVGANTVWLMPVHPHNDTWSLPDACDNLGSPYAVRDYMHVRGSLSRACIEQGRDEHSEEPCWGDGSMGALIDQAAQKGMSVMMDMAFNHFGHNYQLYDVVGFDPVRERIARGDSPSQPFEDFDGTYDERLLYPEVLDTAVELQELVDQDAIQAQSLDQLQQRCPGLQGHELVRAFGVWRVALDWERNRFPCDVPWLEYRAPGFYAGSHHGAPSQGPGDNFTNNWVDVKFLFHHGPHAGSEHEYYRNREYMFRIMNYWVSRGVDAFRLDHTTDHDSGLSPDDWKYILSKVTYYAKRRGQATPVFLAEEFHDQGGMARVTDVMIDGYVRDMTGRHGAIKDTARVEGIVANMDRFGGKTYVMTALETHDEKRLTDGTGFDAWVGAGFWGIGAATWSVPMILMGQEQGEPWRLAFRKSDFLRSRFEGTQQAHPQAAELQRFYRDMITARLTHRNRALYSSNRAFLRASGRTPLDPGVFAMAKWSDDGNVVLVFHNLWRNHVQRSYTIDDGLATALGIQDHRQYRLVDALGETPVQDACLSGADLKWGIPVSMSADTRLLWLRLEQCD